MDLLVSLSPNFNEWTGKRLVSALGTNAGSIVIPFQQWRRFKEAFAPELIAKAVASHPAKVKSVLDPFGGSGTTALACQFLNVRPTTIEVNPFLADLIQAKLEEYEPAQVASELGSLIESARNKYTDHISFFSKCPRTFIEPGDKDRWIFNTEVAQALADIISCLPGVNQAPIRNLFKVLLGSAMIEASNVVVSGKGRRYRNGWQERTASYDLVFELFLSAVGRAVKDIARHAGQRSTSYTLLRGDSRRLVKEVEECDLAIYSPPYPNSFDYTDVYNVELWMLGYLTGSVDNQSLRNSTLSSHVQLFRNYPPPPKTSKSLNRTLDQLESVKSSLWNRHIPSMVGAYFQEMLELAMTITNKMPRNGRQWLVVGDSRYAGIDVPVASILIELFENAGLTVFVNDPFRSMRSAPQQGGLKELPETLLVIGTD